MRLDRGQQHQVAVKHLCPVGIARHPARTPADPVELAPAHEAGRGHRRAAGIDVDQRVARRIKRHRPPADRHGDHPGPGRDHREGRPSRQKMGQQRGVGIVDAADHRGSRRQPGPCRNGGQHRPEDRIGSKRRRHHRADPQPPDQRREPPRRRFPQIGMRPQRRQVAGRHPGQQMAPELRPGDDPRHPVAQAGFGQELPVDLRPEVQPQRQPRRSGLREIRADRVIGGGGAFGPVMLIIQNRRGEGAACVEQRPTGAMAGNRDGVDPVGAVQPCQPVQHEIADRRHVEMRPGRAGQHPVRQAQHRHLGRPVRRLQIDQRQFHIGLADVDHRDMARAHRLPPVSQAERPGSAAPPPARGRASPPSGRPCDPTRRASPDDRAARPCRDRPAG